MRPLPARRSRTDAVDTKCAEPLDRQVIRLRDETETHFVAAGSRLAESADLLSRVQPPLAQLSELETGGALGNLRHFVEQFHSDLVDLTSFFLEALSEIGALDRSTRELERQLASIRRVIKTMNIVVLNARVAVAAMGTSKGSLGGFADDATSLVDEAMAILSGLESAVAGLHRQSLQAHRRAKKMAGTIENEARRAVTALNAASEAFGSDIRSFARSGDNIARKTQGLMAATARAVAALQIGDTTRQRLDHIAEILVWPMPSVAATGLSDLAAAQLLDTAKAHDEGISALIGNMQHLETEMSRLVQDHLVPFGRNGGGGPRDLRASLDMIETIIAESLAAQKFLADCARKFESELNDLDRLVDSGGAVENRMRMIGLNAVIACAELGPDGLALKEISLQLQELARETAGQFPVLKSCLAEMLAVSFQTGLTLKDASERAHHLSHNSAKAVCRQIDAITAVQNEAIRVALDVGKALGRSSAPLDCIAHHSDLLTSLAQKQHLKPLCAPLAGSDIGAALDAIGLMYTMNCERDVHRAFAANLPSDVSTDEKVEPVTQLDDIFF